jgi:hypothetical protein
MQTMHLLPSVAIQPILELKTWPKQLLGSLPSVFALPNQTQASVLGILITFVNTFHFNLVGNVCVFYFCIFSNKFDLFIATCCIITLFAFRPKFFSSYAISMS